MWQFDGKKTVHRPSSKWRRDCRTLEAGAPLEYIERGGAEERRHLGRSTEVVGSERRTVAETIGDPATILVAHFAGIRSSLLLKTASSFTLRLHQAAATLTDYNSSIAAPLDLGNVSIR